MAELNSTKVYDFKTFIDEFPLPQVVKVTEGVYSNEDEMILSALKELHLLLIKNCETVKATDERNREFYLPLNSPAKVKVLPNPFYQEFYIDVRKMAKDFPAFVQACGDDPELNIEVGDVLKLKGLTTNPHDENYLKCECINKEKKDIWIPISYEAKFKTLGDFDSDSLLFLKEVVANASSLPVLVKFEDNVLKTRRSDINVGCPTGFNQLGTFMLKEVLVMKLVVASSGSVDDGSERTLFTIPHDMYINVTPVLDKSEHSAYRPFWKEKHHQISSGKINFNETSFRYGFNIIKCHGKSKQDNDKNPAVTASSSGICDDKQTVSSCPDDETQKELTARDDVMENEVGINPSGIDVREEDEYVDMSFCKDIPRANFLGELESLTQQQSKDYEASSTISTASAAAAAAAAADDDDDDGGGYIDDGDSGGDVVAADDDAADDDDCGGGYNDGGDSGGDAAAADDDGGYNDGGDTGGDAASAAADDDDGDGDDGGGDSGGGDVAAAAAVVAAAVDDDGGGGGSAAAAAAADDDDDDAGGGDGGGGSDCNSNVGHITASNYIIPPTNVSASHHLADDETHEYDVPVIPSRWSFNLPTNQTATSPRSTLENPSEDIRDDVFQGARGHGHLGLPRLLPVNTKRRHMARALSLNIDFGPQKSEEEEEEEEEYVRMGGGVGADETSVHLEEGKNEKTNQPSSISSDPLQVDFSTSTSSPCYNIEPPPSISQKTTKKTKSKIRRSFQKLSKMSRSALKRSKSTPEISISEDYHYVESIPEAKADKESDIAKAMSRLHKFKKRGSKDLSPINYLSTLTVDEVSESLKSLNLHRYVETFRSNTVDGSLFMDLNDKMLDELEVTSELDRLKIRKLQKEGWTPRYQ